MIRDNNVTPLSLLIFGYLSVYSFSCCLFFGTSSKVNNVLSNTQKNQAESLSSRILRLQKYQRGVLKAAKIMLLLRLLKQLVPSYLY